jgi:hypothetical protein
MMAPDSSSTPQPRSLSESTLRSLQAAIVEHLNRSPAADEMLARAIREMVSEARARTMRPEELIVAFKSVYDALPEPASAAARAEQLRLREQVITAAIRAYYSNGAGH